MGQEISELRGVARLEASQFFQNIRKIITGTKEMGKSVETSLDLFNASFAKSGAESNKSASSVESAARRILNAMGDIQRRAAVFGSALGSAFDKVAPHAQRLGANVSMMATRVALAMTAVGAAVIGGTAAMGFEFLSLQQQSQVAFETMLGSAQKAQSFLAELQAFAAATPFEFPGLISSAQKLLAMGFAAEEVIPMLTNIGDATAALGGSPELLGRITTVLGQMKQKGKVQAEEMLQLAESGIPAWEFLAKKLGVDIPAAMAMVSAGTVTADVAISALLGGMEAKFGGLMAKQSASFAGMISTMKDNARAGAAFIVEPMFLAVNRVMSVLMNGGATQQLNAVMVQLRGTVAGAANALQQFVLQNQSEIIRQFAEALQWTVDTALRFAAVMGDVGPPLVSLAQVIVQLTLAVTELAAQIPFAAEFLAVFAIGHVTGINSVLYNLFMIIMNLVTSAGSLATAAGGLIGPLGSGLATAATTAATSLGAVGLALGGVVAIGAVAFFAALAYEASQLNAQMQETLAAMDRMRDKAKTDREKRIDAAGEQYGAAGTAGALRAEREKLLAQKKREESQSVAADSSAAQARAKSEKDRELFGSSFIGGATTRVADSIYGSDADRQAAEAKRAKEQVAKTEKELADVERRLKQAERAADAEARARPAPTAGATLPGSTAGAKPGLAALSDPALGAAVANAMQNSPQLANGAGGNITKDQLKAAKQQAKDDSAVQKVADQFGETLAGAAEWLPEQEIAQFNAQFASLGAQVQAGTMSVEQFSDATKELEETAKDWAKSASESAARVVPASDLAHGLHDLRGTTSAASQSAMENKFVSLQQGAASGAINQQEWQAGMTNVGTARDASARFAEGMTSAQESLKPGAQMDPAQVAALNAQFDQLVQGFMNGQMGAERFNREMGNLSQATAKAAEEANKAAMAEQRKAALAPFQGMLDQAKGAHPMVRQALEDRLLSIQKSRFNAQVDGMVNKFLRLNGVVEETTHAFSEVPGQIENSGAAMSQGSQVSMDQAREGFGQFFGWLSSAGGQIAQLQNSISFAYQRLSIVRNKDNRLASQILEQINGMTAEINRLMNPTLPLFSEANGAQVSFDPGLQTRNSVQIDFPNVTRMTNEDVSKMADRLEYELRRRGRTA
jgi:tape measure domain-containing protein